MIASPLLSFPDGFVVAQVRVLYDCVTICIRSTTLSAVYPLCSQPARRIHSHYQRTVADLPSGGRQLASSSSKRKKAVARFGPSDQLLVKRAVRLLLRRPSELTPTEQETVQMLLSLHPDVKVVYQLAQGFLFMMDQHQAGPPDSWLTAVRCCGIAELERFGRGIEQDKAAVQAGLTLPYSNGVVEGHVNRLKLIKRMMYGRARLPLLRQQVLHAA